MEQVELLAGEQQPDESKKAVIACNDYLRMGPGRSLRKLRQMYGESTVQKPPTKSLRILERWSSAYSWQARAESYDAALDREKTQATESRRKLALEAGLALDYERVSELKLLANFLRHEIFEINKEGQVKGFKRDNIWLPDVKGIGKGGDFERIDLVRFNKAILEEYQSLIDDLAKEVGGRKQKLEHSGEIGAYSMTLEEWKAAQQKAQAQVTSTLADFEDEEPGGASE